MSTKPTAINSTVTLVNPQTSQFIGAVAAVTERSKGGKFEHDTIIISCSNIVTGDIEDIFVTKKQFVEYGLKQSVYRDNIIQVELEECIANVTGYKASADDEELTPHTTTYKAFNRILNSTAVTLRISLVKMGIDKESIDGILFDLAAIRARHETSSSDRPATISLM